jgi:hypothetical protein
MSANEVRPSLFVLIACLAGGYSYSASSCSQPEGVRGRYFARRTMKMAAAEKAETAPFHVVLWLYTIAAELSS